MLTYNVAGTPTPFTAQCAGAFSEAEEAELLTSPAPLVTIKPTELAERIAVCEQTPEPEYRATGAEEVEADSDEW